MKNALQEVLEQVGMNAVNKSVGIGLRICNCEVHGLYACAETADPKCPTCISIPTVTNEGNGESASAVSHYINPGQELGTNPHQKANPLGL